MTDQEIQIILGSLLHDVGKVIYRVGEDKRKHSLSGYDFLKDEIHITDQEVLDAVRYHHGDLLKSAGIRNNSLAYITYISDNIASAADRREKDSEDVGFEITTPLQSVFNLLNGNSQEYYYKPMMLDPEGAINFPQMEKVKFEESFYHKVKANLTDNLNGIHYSKDYINSLLEVLEANLTYVPSSTAKHEMADISLFDHMKLTAAIASDIYQYCEENGITDYKEAFFRKAGSFYEEKAFLLYSMDISGIQDYIYTITTKNALKTLRARSFYLEIMMEHMMDELLEELHLSRANIIYAGGGHCYMLLPNTDLAIDKIEDFGKKTNQWLMENFHTALYVAYGYVPCSSDALKNKPVGSYSALYEELGKQLSLKKNHRYQAKELMALNSETLEDYSRECKVCKQIGETDEEGVCSTCRNIEQFSKQILNATFFTVVCEKRKGALPLPGGFYLLSDTAETLRKKMQEDDYYVRSYSKNKSFTGKQIATKIWVGDYSVNQTFEEMAEKSQGIQRIGILRGDVDNLGHAFVEGFQNEQNQNRYVTLSRTATLSRQLSLFFKLHINKILGESNKNIAIVYSGGDDMFLAGAWNEILEVAIEMQKQFEKYTQGMLTFSAGIGLYDSSYPISVMAKEVEKLEDSSKHLPGKNAITFLWDGKYHEHQVNQDYYTVKDGTYAWKEFIQEVLGEKYQVIAEYFQMNQDKGKNLLYHLLDLIREQGERINFARYVYLLARLEPEESASGEVKMSYQNFSKNMYQWIHQEKDRIQLKTAITYYVYLIRERMEEDE